MFGVRRPHSIVTLTIRFVLYKSKRESCMSVSDAESCDRQSGVMTQVRSRKQVSTKKTTMCVMSWKFLVVPVVIAASLMGLCFIIVYISVKKTTTKKTSLMSWSLCPIFVIRGTDRKKVPGTQ